jgi:AraC-like DNA-binding protein
MRRVQMTKAKQLLLETDFPLKKIAELVGYEHPEYLSVVFKRTTEISPGSYRRRIQAGAGFRPQANGLRAGHAVIFNPDKNPQFNFPKPHSLLSRKTI